MIVLLNALDWFQIITYIKNVSLSLGSEPSKRVYTARGDGNIDYLVMNIQKVGEDYKYVQVSKSRITVSTCI